MIDMVEARVIAGQIAERLVGKTIVVAVLAERKKGSMRDAHLLHVKPEDFKVRLEGTVLQAAYAKSRQVCIETSGGYGFAVWDVYGKILFIEAGAKIPGSPPIRLGFSDGSNLIVLPGVWAAMRLASNEDLAAAQGAVDPDLLDPSSEGFTVEALKRLVEMEKFKGSHIKEILTHYGTPGIMGLMGATCQEVLYRARVHPKRKAARLTAEELAALHRAIQGVIRDAIAAGGRASERDLFDRPGGFTPTVSAALEGKPCPACGAPITAIKMGGAGKFYICPGCQVL
jgi:formamidopyrimidine-DNA glycosylase